ncbi:hypothetical protein EPN52_00025 [bacterium]|nr:MAG: hypothetical protein EPN52_00025 [bacterium]
MDCIGAPVLLAAASAASDERQRLAHEVVAAGAARGGSRDAALAGLARNALFEQAVLAAIRARLGEAKAAVRP